MLPTEKMSGFLLKFRQNKGMSKFSGIQKNQLASLDFRQRLKEELERRKAAKSSFSLRAFASFLETDASTLKKLLEGKRALGSKTIAKMGKRLGLEAQEIEDYVEAHQRRREIGLTLEDDQLKSSYRVLKAEDAPLIANELSFAVLELIRIRAGAVDTQTIATAFDIPESEAKDLVQQLLARNWIERDKDGTYRAILGQTTSDPLDNATIAARLTLMRNILSRSQRAFLETPREFRSHSANTFALDTRKLPEIIAKLKALSREFESFVGEISTEPNAVYQLQIGLFNLSAIQNRSDD